MRAVAALALFLITFSITSSSRSSPRCVDYEAYPHVEAAVHGYPNLHALAECQGYLLSVDDEGLDVLSVRKDPPGLELVSSLGLSGGGTGLRLVGDIAYVMSESQVHFCDLSDPTRPVPLGFAGVEGGRARAIAVEGNHLYVLRDVGEEIVTIFDVRDPSQAERLGSVEEIQTGGVERDIAVVSGHAYLVNGFEELWILDVSNPHEPVFLEKLGLPANGLRVFAAHGALYTLTDLGLYSWDVTDPTAPVNLDVRGMYATGRISLEGRDVLVGSLEYQEPVITRLDISDPGNLRDLWTVPTTSARGGVVEVGDMAVLVSAPNSVELIDNATEAGGIPTMEWHFGAHLSPEDIVVDEAHDVAYLADHSLMIADVTDPFRPDLLGEIHLDRSTVRDVELSESHLYAYAYSFSSLRHELYVFDRTNPVEPELRGSLELGAGFSGVHVREPHVYLHGSHLAIVDVSDPSRPRVVRDVPFRDHLDYVRVQGDHALMGGGRTLFSVDLSNPVYPGVRDLLHFDADIRGMALGAGVAYLSHANSTLTVVNANDFDSLSLYDAAAHLGFGGGLALDDGVLYAMGSRGLHAFDVRDPLHRSYLGGTVSDFFAREIVVSEGVVYQPAGIGTRASVYAAYCDPTEVPVLLQSFEVVAQGDQVRLRVSLSEPVVSSRIRVLAIQGVRSREVALRRAEGGFEAVDRPAAGSILYRLELQGLDGDWERLASRASEAWSVPVELELRAWPSPANPRTRLEFIAPRGADVTLAAYDTRGRMVETLERGTGTGEVVELEWGGENLASGVYFLRLQAGDRSVVQKVTLVR